MHRITPNSGRTGIPSVGKTIPLLNLPNAVAKEAPTKTVLTKCKEMIYLCSRFWLTIKGLVVMQKGRR